MNETTETAVLGERTWVLDLNPTDARVLVSGFQSWSEAELRPLSDKQNRPILEYVMDHSHDPQTPPSGEAGRWVSHAFVAVLRPDGSGWAAATGDAAHSFTTFEVRAEGQQVWLTARVEGPDTPVTFVETADVIGALESLAAGLGRQMKALTPPPRRVWCSWYSYFREVTLENMLENAREARALNLPFDTMQLDDGFQSELGDWTTASEHFGGHARDLPAQLRGMGYAAGIWLAPFLVSPSSEVFKQHPHWVLGTEEGEPKPLGDNWGGPFYALDTTHPEVLEHLRALAAEVVGWGYSYLKIDFLFGAAMPGVRHDPSRSRAEAYRMGLQAIRDGAGEDTFILGCGAPLAGSVGLVDAMRIGPDVALQWGDTSWLKWVQDASVPSTRNALYTSLSRWYLHPLYSPDPDVAIVRREQSLLNNEERGALVGLLDVIGGVRASSDPMSTLDEPALKLLRQALELSTPDRPRTLAESYGDAVTHFTRGTFNLTNKTVDGQPPHSYRPLE